MNLEDVKKYFEENKDNEEVKAYLEELKGQNSLTVEEMQKLVLENDEFKRWFDSERDKHFSKGLETWKTNNLQKIIEEEIKKRYPDESDEDTKLRELEQKIKQLELEKTRESLSKKALEYATENNLPTSLISLFVANDEETTLKYLENFKNVWNNQVQKVKEQLIKDNGVDPKSVSDPQSFTTKDISKMTSEEFKKYYESINKNN